jgi:hypothetical protein
MSGPIWVRGVQARIGQADESQSRAAKSFEWMMQGGLSADFALCPYASPQRP